MCCPSGVSDKQHNDLPCGLVSVFIAIYSFFNLIEVIVGFAVLYLSTGAIVDASGHVVEKPVEALFFSATTMLTVGFGNQVPFSTWGECLVLSQYAALVIFMLLVLPLLLSGLSSRMTRE